MSLNTLRRHLMAWTLAATAGAAVAQSAPTVVGIANFGPHPALQQAIDGFKAEMARAGYEEGRNVRYVTADANFSPAMIPQILNQIEANKPSVILTVTTPVSQAAITSVTNKALPLVFLLISDPVAAGLVPNWQQGGPRFVGSASAMDYDAVMAFSKDMFPGAKSFGVMYSPGEANDVVAIRQIEGAAQRAGITLKAVSVDAAVDVPQRAQLLSDVDFIYVIGSNLVQSAMPAVTSVADRYRIPILSAETEFIKKGLVTVSYAASYPLQGASAAKLAVELLKGKKTSELAPIKPSRSDYTAIISRKKMAQLGKPVPPAMANCNCFIE